MSNVIYAEPDGNKKVKFDRGEMEERIVDIYVSADTLRDGETSTKSQTLLLIMDQETSTQMLGAGFGRELDTDRGLNTQLYNGFEDDEPDAMKNTDIDGQLHANIRAFKPSTRDGDVASVHVQWWKRTSGVAAVCLGLLCVLLLAGIIGLSVYYGVAFHHDSTEREQLQDCYNNLTKERDQLQSSYNTLTKERVQLQSSYNSLTKERDQLQTSYNNLTKERVQLQSSYNTLTKERVQLQSSYNTLTKERVQLQSSYNTLTKERRVQLQTSYNNLTKERDQLQSSNNNLTKERDQLQTERVFLNGRFTNLKQNCPAGWQKFESIWYFLSTETKTWKESREDCLERGADLVIINSDKEQRRVWIGLTDSVIEGTWKWVDGTPTDHKAHPVMTLQHDNASSHTARFVRDFLQDRNASVLPGPAKSPYSNPIEPVWDLLDRRVRARTIPPRIVQELAGVLVEEWDNIS
ncbi:C-type lectin domain family 4 member M-like [Oncorhynchus masou masou]|uniref:C-type lectin domain family 4 member M-like n=1 Tax=Oncorhynchus masou masou TaxID=90313 RepID=UPI003183D125